MAAALGHRVYHFNGRIPLDGGLELEPEPREVPLEVVDLPLEVVDLQHVITVQIHCRGSITQKVKPS